MPSFINKTWSPSEAPTAAQFNTHIRDNFTVLKDLPYAQNTITKGSNITTTSLTATLVDALFIVNITPSITSGLCTIDIYTNFNLRCSSTATFQVVKFRIDMTGFPIVAVPNITVRGNSDIIHNISFYYRRTGVAPGLSTINLAWWTTGGTATIFSNPADANHAEGQFGAKESS